MLRSAGFRRWSPVSKRHRALHVSPNHPGFCDEGSLIRKQRVVKLRSIRMPRGSLGAATPRLRLAICPKRSRSMCAARRPPMLTTLNDSQARARPLTFQRWDLHSPRTADILLVIRPKVEAGLAAIHVRNVSGAAVVTPRATGSFSMSGRCAQAAKSPPRPMPSAWPPPISPRPAQ